MKISPIAQQQNQTFKGLWGETNVERYMLDSTYYIYEHRKIKDYYPFLDETKDEVAEVIRKNEYFEGGLTDLVDASSCVVNLKESLNFTKKEWEKYLAGKLKGALDIQKRLTAELIENNLRKLKLTKYIK